MSTQEKQNQEPGINVSFNISVPRAIIIGSVIISLSILISGGVIKIKGFSPTQAALPSTTAQAPTQPTQPTQQAPQAPTKADADLGHFPIKGNDNAKVAIVEFGDFRCPFCEKFFTDTESQVLKDYIDTGKVKFTFRNFQFLGPASITAGNAAECANEQGKFWQYHDWLYKNQPSESDTSLYVSDKLTSAAGDLGLNTTQFKSCLDSTKYAKNVTDDQAAGTAAGVSGTPSFIIGKVDPSGKKVIGGQLLVGAQPYSAIKTVIDQQLSQ